MMKGFLKISKLMGLMLLASGLLFAGCGAPGGSSEDAVAGSGGFMIPVTMDMASQTLTIGDGAGMAVGTWDGHQVGLANAAPCTGGALAATCTIRVTNLDPDYYMANTFITLSYCNDCAGDMKFSNADISNGVTVHVSLDPAGAGGEADINGAAYCVAEDGVYEQPDNYFVPYNYYGCSTVYTKDRYQPVQYLHPDCGSRDVQWDFESLTGTNRLFYVNIAAQWFPEDVTGDTRFDFENRTTYYLTANALDDKISGAVNKAWWRLGSYKRSTTLTGYGSGGGKFTPAPGRYFALNVLVEAPDRMERYTGVGYPTVESGFSPYEYYTSFSYIVRYDPTVIKVVTAISGVTKKLTQGGTTIYGGGLDLCNLSESAAHCDKNKPTFTGFDSARLSANAGGAAEEQGWLFAYLPISQTNFSWNAPGAIYQTTFGDDIMGGSGYAWMVHAGHVGMAKVNMVPYKPSVYPNTNFYPSQAIVPSGTPDPEPEMGLGMYYFKVQPGTSGKGTELYTRHWSSENGPLININANTPAGGLVTGNDDWPAPCLPATPGFEANQGCDPDQTIFDYWVYKQSESSNPNIRQSGYNVPGQGAYQYWNIHLCVL